MLKAVIFDMDGVIIDSEPLHLKTNLKVFSELGIIISNDEYKSYIGLSSREMWTKIKIKHNLVKTVSELEKIGNNSYYKYLCSIKNIKPINGVIELIKDLISNNIKIGLASSSPKMIINAVLDIFSIEYLFDVVVSGEEVKKSKPEPDIFILASKLLKIKADNIAVIEDSHNGVIASKKAKMKCIAYKDKNAINQDLSCADLIIYNFYDLNYRKINKLIIN